MVRRHAPLFRVNPFVSHGGAPVSRLFAPNKQALRAHLRTELPEHSAGAVCAPTFPDVSGARSATFDPIALGPYS